MAAGAGRSQAEVCTAQILHLNGRALDLRDMLGGVAAIACQTGMLALQDITSLLVIEGLEVPLNQRKIKSVVLRVTTGALLAGCRVQVIGRVQAAPGAQAGCNLAVTVETLERRLAAKLVTGGALCGAVKRAMRTRKRARGDLRPSHPGKAADKNPPYQDFAKDHEGRESNPPAISGEEGSPGVVT